MQKADFDDWITVKILRTQHQKISKLNLKKLGYSNEADFIRDAIREKLGTHK